MPFGGEREPPAGFLDRIAATTAWRAVRTAGRGPLSTAPGTSRSERVQLRRIQSARAKARACIRDARFSGDSLTNSEEILQQTETHASNW